MQEKRYNDAKKEIRSVLLTYQSCITLDEFLKSYKNILGERLPSRTLGFYSDVEFLQSMPDVVNVRTDNHGKVLLTGIADETSQHIQKLVSKQRKSHPKSSKSNNNFQRQRMPSKPPVIQEQTFLPSALRAEILEVMDMYHDGVTFCTFAIAYHRKFNKYLPLVRGLDSLESMISLIPELEIRSINDEKVIYFTNNGAHDKELETSVTMKNIPSSVQSKDKDGKKTLTNCISPKIHKSGISEAVLQNFKLVLEKCPEGIPDIHLPSLYEHLTQKSFDLHELGYSSIMDLVDALPHIFKRVLNPEGEKNWIILPAKAKIKNFSNGTCTKTPVGIPADAVSPSLQFLKATIPQNLDLNQHIPVFVSAINNPELFWFQLQMEDTIKEFEKFEKDIGYFYDHHAGPKYVMHDSDITIGSTCVVCNPEDKIWYRAIIKSIPNMKSVNVSFADYGSRENIPRSNVYYVRNKYHDYPAQAFKAHLAGLKPAKDAKTWDAKALQRFIQLCECPFLMARLNPVDEDTFSVHLCNVSGESDVHISDTLIREGFAETYFGNLFHKNYLESDCRESVSDGISSDRESYFSSESAEHIRNEITSESDAEMFNARGKLVFSPQKQVGNSELNTLHFEQVQESKHFVKQQVGSSELNTLHFEQVQESKRFVKQVDICEECKIHVINLEKKLFMTRGELSKLLWKDKDSSFLIERLKYKEVNIPFITISKESHVSLFEQCICYKIPEYEKLKPSNSSLVLYPLQSAFEVLNVFGYPYPGARLAIKNEILSYDPFDPVWKEFNHEELADLSDIEKSIEEQLNKLCLYDLKAKNEALVIKKLKLLRIKNDSATEEIKNIDYMQKAIERRMKRIEAICSQYSSLS